MHNQSFNDWSAFSAESLQKIQRTNQEILEKANRELISLGTDNAAEISKYLQTITRATSLEDALKIQLKFMSQLSDKTSDYLHNMSKICQDAFKEHTDLAKENVNSAMKTSAAVNKDRK